MIKPGQLRGMLLEEAVLFLLRRSGYTTIDQPGTDPTLCSSGAGLAVRGRGSEHQIDAIADFVVHHPFSNPQRLFVESKCYDSNYKIGIEVVRNAVGVLKDSSEFWTSAPAVGIGRGRYHYQYAIFSASPFSRAAQRYAFAQDVHLLPLDRSRYFRPILDAIRRINMGTVMATQPLASGGRQFSEFRAYIRSTLRSDTGARRPSGYLATIDVEPFFEACHRLKYALVAVLGGCFPVLLAPSRALSQDSLPEEINVRIFWDAEGWYIRNRGSSENLFSFDLPDELFDLYATDGLLGDAQALNLKQQAMSTFQAIETKDGRVRLITFKLDQEWISVIRSGLD